MKTRPSARLLVLDPQGRVLLFRFSHSRGPLAGLSFWATPGGALDGRETFAEAAIRELHEETGIAVTEIGEAVAEQTFPMQLPNGEWVTAVEQFFLVWAKDDALSRAGWSAGEHETMVEHRWWTLEEIAGTSETVYPENLAAMIAKARASHSKRLFA